MDIKEARFIVSNTDVNQCPDEPRPEYAFIGRSNVGKSSLINMITNRKNLAKTSSMPGKTQLINHFLINNQWFLVDLPGYGYAQRGKKNRQLLQDMIQSYILNRENLTSLFVLIDSRHEPQKIDLEFTAWLGKNGVPFSLVFTKTDKQSQTRTMENIENYKQKLLETWEELPPIFLTSSVKQTGKEEILNYIEEINRTL